MRVLVVLAQPPHHEGGAPGRCSVALVRGLLEHGLDVTAVAARVPGTRLGATDALPVEIIDVTPPTGGLGSLPRRARRPRGWLAASPFGERVRTLALDADVVHLEQTETAWCDEGVAVPSLVHLHYRIRLDRHRPPLLSEDFRALLEFSAAERAAIRRHRFLVASSPVVARTLAAERADADVTVAPLGLDPRFYEAAPLDGPPVAGLIGTGSWPVTARAIRRAVEDVWPRVRRLVPAARLRVAGRDLGAVSGLRAGEGVELVGEVESAAEFLRGLSLLLYPLDFGSGVKVKVLEALASGVPVVTTACGAEGVDAGEGVVVGAGDDELAASTVRLLRDEGELRRRGAAARRAYLERYTPHAVTAPLVDLYGRIVPS